MQSIALHDTVTVRTETGDGDITVRTDREDLPGGPGNIAWKAARAFYDAVGMENGGTEILLEKRIPIDVYKRQAPRCPWRYSRFPAASSWRC